MVGHTKLRLLACTAFVSVLALAASSVASADTQVATLDPTVTAVSSLVSSGNNPNIANRGDWINIRASVKNNLRTSQFIRVNVFGGIEGTAFQFDYSFLKEFRAGQIVGLSFWIPVFRFTPSGLYSLTVGTIGETCGFDCSSATSSLTVDSTRRGSGGDN